jgi:serine protease Do
VAASIGGGLIAAFAVASHSNAPMSVVARADTKESTQRVSQLSNSFADVIEKASPAVVTISSTRVIKASEQQGQNPFSADPFFRQFFGGQGGQHPRDERERGLGSGVIVSPDGYILTNNHVVDKATSLKVALSDGRSFSAKTVGTDPQTDLAVVRITASSLPVLPFANSDSARVGDLCFAIGNPYEQDHTVTMGIVSAKGRHLEASTHIQDFIQTDAAINPGNSGGALINAHGDLIGINTMILTGGGGSPFGGGEGGSIGIGFAIPSNMAKGVMEQIEKSGKVTRGYLGATLGTVTNDMAPLLGLKEAKGAVLDSIAPNGPAQKAGLQMGDVVTAIDGKSVKGMDDLTMDVIAHSPGSTVKLDVVRNGKPMEVSVRLGQRPNAVDWDQKKQGDNDNGDNGDNDNGSNTSATARGITVQPLTPEIAQQINVPPSTKGVVVSDIDASSPAADAQALGKGAVILAVNRQPVSSVGEFKRLMNQANGKAVLLTVNVGGQTAFTVVQP